MLLPKIIISYDYDNFLKKIRSYGETFLRKEVDIQHLLEIKNDPKFGIVNFTNIFHQNPESSVLKGIDLLFNSSKDQIEISIRQFLFTTIYCTNLSIIFIM